MRNHLKTVLAAGAVMAAAAFVSPANAMTLPAPAGFAAAIEHASPVQDAAYYCRPAWRCGYWGCGWRRACWSGGYGYYRPHRWGDRWAWGHRW